MIQSFRELAEAAARSSRKTAIALCCAEDPHSLEALAAARKAGHAEAYLIGDPQSIRERLTDQGERAEDYEILPGETPEQAVRVAAELVRKGQVGAIMKGKMQTADLMRNVLKAENGLRDSAVLSVCGNFEWRGASPNPLGGILTVTDPALNVHPGLEQKKAILENAVRLRRALGDECPRVAAIAANEVVSPKIPETVDAGALKEMNLRGEIQNCLVEGPISLDLALRPEAAELKGYRSPVAGNAGVLLMPDLVSANVLAKSLTEIAGCDTAGVVLGARVPIILVSRSSTAADKYNSIALAAYIAERY